MTAWPAQALTGTPQKRPVCHEHTRHITPRHLSALLAPARSWHCAWHSRGPICPRSQSTALDTADSYDLQQQAVLDKQRQEGQQQQQQQQQQARAEDAALLKQRLNSCPVCSGSGRVACKECSGRGFLPRGGYSKKNPLNLSRAVGSKWTAMTETLGWRHFRVTAVRKLDKHKHNTYLLLQASCDSTVQLWVNALTVRNRSCWAAGWLQMSELIDEEGVAIGSGHKCHSCAGLGFRACSACDGRGRADLVEV